MKKNFLEAIRDWFGFGESPKEKVYEDLSEVEKWQGKVSSRYFNKDDLLCFVQFGHEKAKDNVYIMCGYFIDNNKKFKDIATGNIYDIFDAPYPDCFAKCGESCRSTILKGGSPFVMIRPTIFDLGGKNLDRAMYVGLTGTVLSSTEEKEYLTGNDEGIVLMDNLDNEERAYTKAKGFYKLFVKDYVDNVVSGYEVLKAVNQVNQYCIGNVETKIKRQEENNSEMGE